MRNHLIKWVGIIVLILTTNTRAEDFKPLLELYRSYEMPEAPTDAPLVQFRAGTGWEDGIEKKLYNLGFLLTPRDARPVRVLVGTTVYDRSFDELKEIKPDDVQIDQISCDLANFSINEALATSMQCLGRGWEDLSARLLERAIVDHNYAGRTIFTAQPNSTAREQLVCTIWAYQAQEISNLDTDRRKISNRMHRLLDEKLSNDKFRDNKIEFLKSLDAALEPGNSTPGSVESLIDKLVDLNTDSGDMMGRLDDDPLYVDISIRGFDAIPALIEHVDDERLTRSMQHGFNNFSSWNRRVGDVVCDLLSELAGEDFERIWFHRQLGKRIDKAAARAWFDKVKHQSEIEFAMDHLVNADQHAFYVSPAWLRIIQARYPDRLGDAYQRVIDDPREVLCRKLVNALINSDMPQEAKLQALSKAISSSQFEQKQAALNAMKSLAPDRAVDELIGVLDRFPTATKSVDMTHPEADFIDFAWSWNDERVRKAIEGAIARADPGLKIEILDLGMFACDFDYPRLALLVRYLDDAAVYEWKKEYSDHKPSFHFPRIEVRNFAALKIELTVRWHDEWAKGETSMSYGMSGDDPRKKWTAEQWAEFRDRVRAEAEKRLKSETK